MSTRKFQHGLTNISTALTLIVKKITNSALNPILSRTYSKSVISLLKLLKQMPKENRKNANKSKFSANREKYKNEPASIITLQVIGTGSNGTPKSFCVFSDHQSYLFNCGEGTQRLSNEHKTKMYKTDNIFITYKHWDNIGGLAGLSLTFQDMGITNYTLHGPPRIECLFTAMHSFMSVAHVKINKHEYFDDVFEDGVLRIECVPIFSTKCVDFEVNNGLEECEDDQKGEKSCGSRSRSPSPVQNSPKRQKIAPELQDKRDISIAYICKTHSTHGHLLMDKCNQLGIPKGPILGKLKKGQDVTLPDGRLIKSTDVVSPTQPGLTFIVIDCPNEHFLDSLLQTNSFVNHEIGAESEDIAQLIVHFTPNDVLNDPKYKIWISKFPPTTRHLILNKSCPGIANAAIYKLQHKLNVVHSQIFPLLQTNYNLSVGDDFHFILGEPLMQFSIKPKFGLDRSKIMRLEPDLYINEVVNSPNWSEKFKLFKNSIENSGFDTSKGIKYPQVIFLGTGSCIPSKVRNVSCILIKINSLKWMILDCGEGSYGQILRFFGLKETENIMKNIVAVFISHLHADHHTGLIQILHERKKVLRISENEKYNKLYLLAPFHMNKWLNSYHKSFSHILDQFNLVSNIDLVDNHLQMTDKYKKMMDEMQLKDVNTVKVIHRALTFGVVITFKDGVKLVYSGDTMPCEDLVKAGKKCHLLIHEATMEDFLTEDAKNKTHSTTSQAIDIGRRMEAKFTLLTHFSQRYAKVPIFTDNFNGNVGIAFDNMKVSMDNVAVTSLFRPILEVIFSQEIEEMLDKREMKMRQKVWEKEKEKSQQLTKTVDNEVAVKEAME